MTQAYKTFKCLITYTTMLGLMWINDNHHFNHLNEEKKCYHNKFNTKQLPVHSNKHNY